jgi:hypothetical protein
MKMKRYDYEVVRVDPKIVWIVDNATETGALMSVTNAAEYVVEEVAQTYGRRRIIYRDTAGRWDELLHDGTRFKGFKLIGSWDDEPWRMGGV